MWIKLTVNMWIKLKEYWLDNSIVKFKIYCGRLQSMGLQRVGHNWISSF